MMIIKTGDEPIIKTDDEPAQRPRVARVEAPSTSDLSISDLSSPGQPRPAPEAPKSYWLFWLFVLAIGSAGAYYGIPRILPLISFGNAPIPVAAPKVVPVLASAVRQGDMELYLNGLGTVTAFYTVTLRSRVDGQLDKVRFSEGQMVREGDLLAEIDPRPFEVQLQEAEGQLTKDEASLKVAQLDLDRYTSLRRSGSVTQQQLDGQIALVKQSQGALQVDQGQIANARLQITYSKITAPISGRIGLRMVDPGNMVHANDPAGMAVITQLQPIALVFTIPQDDIARVQIRMKTGQPLEVDAYDRDFKMKLASGTLLAIDNQVDATTGTVKLKAIFKNEDNMLFPNQFVNARLLVDVKRDAVIVPSAVVQRGPDSMFCYIVKADSTVEKRDVTIGPTEGDITAIETGLAPGENVVTDGVDKLQNGTKVVVRDSTQRSLPGKPSGPARTSADNMPARSSGDKGI
jgi:multidrug efflux system membrane fusion protein